MKIRSSLIVLSLLCLSISACGFNPYRLNFLSSDGPRYAVLDLFSKRNPVEKDTIKIVSYNIEFSRRIDEAIELLRTSEPLNDADIICLQEMSIEGTQKISKELGYNYVYYPAVIHPIPKKSFGNAVLSRWPILDDRKIILPKDNDKKLQRIAVGATINLDGQQIMVYSVHFEVYINPFQRRTNVDRIIESMPKKLDHYIVAGDFNTFTKRAREAIFDEFEKYGFTQITKDIDWTHKNRYLFNKKSTVDHIFIKGIELIDMGKVNNRSASDHVPIWAEFRLIPNQ